MKAKTTYRIFSVFFLAVAAYAALCSCERIKDGMGGCRVYLEFIYDRNMEYTDAFAAQVSSVDVYVFDGQERFLFCRQEPSSQLIGGNRMFLGEDLPFGRYNIMAVGGMKDSFLVSGPQGSALVPGESLMRDVHISLVRASETVSHKFPAMWVAVPVEIDYKADLTVYPVSLIKNTNHFDLLLVKHGENNGAKSENVPYTFSIEASDGAVYGYDNLPKTSERVIYYPYSLETGQGADEISRARINTNRLLCGEKSKYTLKIGDMRTGGILWEYDLILLLENLKPDTRPDGTALPTQEFLDRRSEWPLILIYKEVGGGSLEIGIDVGGWIIWLNDIEV